MPNGTITENLSFVRKICATPQKMSGNMMYGITTLCCLVSSHTTLNIIELLYRYVKLDQVGGSFSNHYRYSTFQAAAGCDTTLFVYDENANNLIFRETRHTNVRTLLEVTFHVLRISREWVAKNRKNCLSYTENMIPSTAVAGSSNKPGVTCRAPEQAAACRRREERETPTNGNDPVLLLTQYCVS